MTIDGISTWVALLRAVAVMMSRGDECKLTLEQALRDQEAVHGIYEETKGYPYFIQYVCRELYDVWMQQEEAGEELTPVSWEGILRKLDADFFAGRWARVTDRQRDLMLVIAHLENSDHEFSVQDVVELSKALLSKPFGGSQTSQMLRSLSDMGLVYKNRWGKYSLAVPLLDQFIRRQMVTT